MKNFIKILKTFGLSLASLFFITVVSAPPVALASSVGSVGTWHTSTQTVGFYDNRALVYKNYAYIQTDNEFYYAQLGSGGTMGSLTLSPYTISRPSGLSPYIYNTFTEYNGYLYALGGEWNNTTTTSVYYSKINSNGSISAWQTASNSLPAALYEATSAVYNGYIYELGGETRPNTSFSTSKAVYYAKLNSDGSVGTWQTANSLPTSSGQGIRNATSVVYNGYIYNIGGYENGLGNIYSVFYAKLNSNGSVGAWQGSSGGDNFSNASSMPVPLMNATSDVSNGYVYVFGGYNFSVPVNYVYYAKLNSDGSASPWIESPNALPIAAYEYDSFIYDNYAYVFGGDDGTFSYNYLYTAYITPPPTVITASIATTTTSSAPNTGYGTTSNFDPTITMLITGAIVSTGFGLTLLYRQKRSS